MSAQALSKELAKGKLDLRMEKRELISALALSMELTECILHLEERQQHFHRNQVRWQTPTPYGREDRIQKPPPPEGRKEEEKC